MPESFVATFKRELVKGRVFTSRFEAEISVVEYLGWFNHTRLHSELGDVPPAVLNLSQPRREAPIPLSEHRSKGPASRSRRTV